MFVLFLAQHVIVITIILNIIFKTFIHKNFKFMQISRHAAGCVVYRKVNDEILFLAAYQKMRFCNNFHWVSPKGLIDKGENSKEAALRETHEEVGIKTVKYICFLGTQKFYLVCKIDWHLVEAFDPSEIKLQVEERFVDSKWVTLTQAKELFTYKDFLYFIDKSYTIIKG
jgi:8-oxo-dGTP pyrophosphatase MutT (NUDIX family)